MWFLLLQIFILMLLAAALGGWLVWWWLNRRYETMAQSRERLVSQVSRIDDLVTRGDLGKEVADLRSLISSHKPVDLQPIEERLARLHVGIGDVERLITDLKFPEADFGPTHAGLQDVKNRLAAITYDPLMARVAEVGAAVANIKPTSVQPLEERLGKLEEAVRAIRMPEVDLGPVHSGLASLGIAVNAMEPKLRGVEPLATKINAIDARMAELGTRLEGARRADMDALSGRLAVLSESLSNLRIPDIAPVQTRLSEVQAAIANIPPPTPAANLQPVLAALSDVRAAITAIPQPNLAPLRASLSDLEAFVVALDKPPVDFTPLQMKLASLESSVGLVQAEVREARALHPIDRRLASLEEALGSMPEPDFAPIIGAVRAIDSRHDLVAVENRLTAIEYGLAALHHMMRSRGETTDSRVGDTRMGPSLHVVREPAPQFQPMPPAPPRPLREADPIAAFLRADDQANLLSEPAFGAPDDLERIDGVGPMLRALLHEVGVFYFWQVAEWTDAEIDWVESKLKHFRGRIRRDDWVGQSRMLASAPSAVKRPAQGMRRPL